MLLIYVYLLLSFLQIGFFGWGGPFALLSFVQHEVVVRHEWLTSAEFADIMALARIFPGNTPLDAAGLAGYRVLIGEYGFGAAVGALALCLVALSVPAFAFSAFSVRYFRPLRRREVTDSLLSLFRPLAPGLVAAAAIMLMNAENFGSPAVNPWQFGISLFLFLTTLIGTGYYRLHPLFMIVLCGVAGLLLY